MANSFWKALGSKLVETGVAYLQQVRVINELKELSPPEAAERFAHYVRGLSSTARAGLAVTLATLASSERDAQARRRIESMRAYLLGQATTAAIEEAPSESMPAAPANRSAPTDADFDADLQRLDEWSKLDEMRQQRAIAQHLTALDTDGLRALQANLERMKRNCAERIQEHHDNEAQFVAGRFFEDQAAYLQSVLRTGQHSPQWLRRLDELQGYADYFDRVHRLVEVEIQGRSRRPPPATQAAPAGDDRGTRRAIEGMRQMLEEQLRSGEVRAERAVALRRLLDQIERFAAGDGGGRAEPAQVIQQLKSLLADAGSMLADPGADARLARTTARGRKIDGYAGAMKLALGRELMEVPPPATEKAIGAILGDLAQFQRLVADADSDEALALLERDLLRPAARARHELALARHALLARPLWESEDFTPQVNAIAFAGAADLQQRLDEALRPRLLTLSASSRLQNHGQHRWHQLNNGHVAVFDLRGASEIAALATSRPKRARELTAAAYELGLAFALGKPAVVVAEAGEAMPFDVDLGVVGIERESDDLGLLLDAIDEAFYVPQRPGKSASIGNSIAFLDRLTAGHPKRQVFERQRWLDPALATDPAGFVACAEQLARQLDPPPWRVLRPAWPAAYPHPAKRRCFHVMPFGPPWANEARDAARSVCKERGFRYRRGDEAEEGRIIHAIWEDLCRANVVLVDLTGGNLNVMIELGMAHAIGRPVIAVQRAATIDLRPRHVEKLRVHAYGSAEDLKQLLRSQLPA